MLVCALTLLATSLPQEPSPVADGPFLIPSVQSWPAEGEQPNRVGVLLHADGSVQILDAAADPTAYPHARVIEAAEDWVLYPGLIHGNFPAGHGETPSNAYLGTASDPTVGPVPAMEYGTHNHFFGWLHAADQADWDAEDANDWRGAGFTSGALLPKRGLLQGQASLLAFNGLPLAEALHQRSGPSLLSLRGTGGYPNTQMAALAMLRQVLLDQGRRDLSPDLLLQEHVVVRANGARQVENILDLQRDFAPKNSHWTILGGREAWKFADRLKEQGVGVLYMLDLEEAPESEEELEADDGEGRPFWQHPLRLREELRREHQERVEDYLYLRAAGVPCALVPGSKTEDFSTAVEQLLGETAPYLTADQVYHDLSIAVLQLLEFRAPEADFVLSRGDYSFEKPDVAWVFTRGRGWEFPKDEEAVEEEAAGGDEGASEEGVAVEGEENPTPEEDAGDPDLLTGEWDLVVETPMGDEEFMVALDPEAGTVEVFRDDAPKDREYASDVKYKGNQVKFGFKVPEPEMDTTVFLKAEGGKIRGKMKTPFGDVPLRGERADGRTAEASGTDDEDDEEHATATGHPQWPVETRLDRFAHSTWAQERTGSVLFTGATLYRMDGSEPSIADLLIEDGLIRSIGSDLAAPEGTAVVYAEGWHIMPGIIDAHSHLALDAINEGSMSITAECRIEDMIHAESVGIYRAAAGGTAVVQSLHGSANPIGGQAATWELDYLATSIEQLLVPEAPRNIKFALGENVKQSNWSGAWGKRFPNSRVGVQATYRRAFRDAQDYAERRRRAEDGELPGFRRDVRLEVLADILENKVHIQCHSYRADELLMFLGICKEFGIERPVFQHVLEGYKVAPELAEVGAMASTFSDWWAYKFEVRDAIPWNVSIMDKAGVVVSINSDSDEMIRRLNTEAAKGQLYGDLGWQAAMATCTLNPAKQLRVDDRLGSLEKGKYGTLTIYDGPPLEGYSRCVMTLNRGIVVYEAPADLDSRWADYSAEVNTFIAADAEQVEDAAAEDAGTGKPELSAEDWLAWTSGAQDSALQINGVTIHPVSGVPFYGSLLVVDGRIAKVAEGNVRFEMPRRTRTDSIGIGSPDMHLYPGFLNGFDRTGIWEYGAVRASRDDIETGTDQPDLSVAAAVHADSEHIPVTRMNGVSYVLVRPPSGRIGGQAALLQLDGITTKDVVVAPDLGLFIQFPRVSRFEQEDGPETPEELEELDQLFADAMAYGEQMDRLASSDRAAYHRDAKLEALLPYLHGDRDVYLAANDAPTLMAARAWSKKHGLKVVYMGARDAWKIAGYLGRDHARVIVSSMHQLPGSRFNPFDAAFRTAFILEAAGCTVGLSTDNPEVGRNLPFQAATAAAWGLGPDKALHAATLGAAEALGVGDFIGSIESGKVATFFLTQGDPLLIEHPVERMWIGGKAVELNSKQTVLRDRYMQRLK
ncbi:MAG: amidohydrolase family protein [Planctomycetota bacterium]|jgi:imidazolonepropionase-like amidohydrolase